MFYAELYCDRENKALSQGEPHSLISYAEENRREEKHGKLHG